MRCGSTPRPIRSTLLPQSCGPSLSYRCTTVVTLARVESAAVTSRWRRSKTSTGRCLEPASRYPSAAPVDPAAAPCEVGMTWSKPESTAPRSRVEVQPCRARCRSALQVKLPKSPRAIRGIYSAWCSCATPLRRRQIVRADPSASSPPLGHRSMGSVFRAGGSVVKVSLSIPEQIRLSLVVAAFECT